MKEQRTPINDDRPTLSETDLDATATMARLQLSSFERKELRSRVQQILSYFDILAEVDVEGVEPTTHVLEQHNRLRPDDSMSVSTQEGHTETAQFLAEAPDREDNHFSVPNVL